MHSDELNKALPVDLNVEETLFGPIKFSHLGYVLPMVAILFMLWSSADSPLPGQWRTNVTILDIAVFMGLASARPYKRGLYTWGYVAARWLFRPREFVWMQRMVLDETAMRVDRAPVSPMEVRR
jgi:hypothetical protein